MCNISNDAIVDLIVAKLSEQIESKIVKIVDEKIQKVIDHSSSPYLCGIDELAKYLGIGKTAATELKNDKVIPFSQRGRLIWFKKADIDKFIQRLQPR